MPISPAVSEKEAGRGEAAGEEGEEGVLRPAGSTPVRAVDWAMLGDAAATGPDGAAVDAEEGMLRVMVRSTKFLAETPKLLLRRTLM